jgi:hypothetical protein
MNHFWLANSVLPEVILKWASGVNPDEGQLSFAIHESLLASHFRFARYGSDRDQQWNAISGVAPFFSRWPISGYSEGFCQKWATIVPPLVARCRYKRYTAVTSYTGPIMACVQGGFVRA